MNCAKGSGAPRRCAPLGLLVFYGRQRDPEGIHADLEAMKKAGIGGAIFLDVDIGIPRGPSPS